jgi:hypothetical protein
VRPKRRPICTPAATEERYELNETDRSGGMIDDAARLLERLYVAAGTRGSSTTAVAAVRSALLDDLDVRQPSPSDKRPAATRPASSCGRSRCSSEPCWASATWWSPSPMSVASALKPRTRRGRVRRRRHPSPGSSGRHGDQVNGVEDGGTPPLHPGQSPPTPVPATLRLLAHVSTRQATLDNWPSRC